MKTEAGREDACAYLFKDVRAKIFYSIDFFKLLPRADNDLLVSKMK